MRSLGMAMSILHFLYHVGPYPWNVGNVCFTFLFSVIILCMMYVYLYMLVCGWSCTLYDWLSWLCERPCLVMSAPNLVLWVYTQGHCCRCILKALYCMHDHCGVIISIHVTKWHWFPRVCNTHQYIWYFEGVSARSSMSMHVGTCHIHRHETLAVCHSALNMKVYRIFTVKIRHLCCRIITVKAWWE